MNIKNVDKALRIIWNMDDSGNKVAIPIVNESHVVVNGKITLLEIPEEFDGIEIKDGITILNEIDSTNTEIEITVDKFRVHYGLGIIFLHKSMEGKTLSVSYSSRGSIMYPASRIYTDINEVDGSLINLQNIVDDVNQAQKDLDNLNDTVTEGLRLEVSLGTQIIDGSKLDADLLQAIIDAESKRQEVLTAISNAENERQKVLTASSNAENEKTLLVQKTTDANNSRTSLRNTIVEAENKKAELDTYELSKEAELDVHTGLKQDVLDAYELTKEEQLDDFKTAKEEQIDDFTTLKKQELDIYVGTDVSPEIGTKKKELDDYELAKEGQLDDFRIAKEEQIDAYTTLKKQELDTKMSDADTKIGEVNTSITDANTAKSNLDSSIIDSVVKKDELDGSIDDSVIKKSELDSSITSGITTKDNLDLSIDDSIGKKGELDSSIASGITTKNNLDLSISDGVLVKSELDNSITNSITAKNNIEGSIADSVTKKNALDGSITDSVTKKLELDSSIISGITTKTNLDSSIDDSITQKMNLDTSINNAENSQSSLETVTTTANTSKANLENAISTANTSKTNLDSSIVTANTKKTELDNSITDADSRHTILQGDIGQSDGKIAEMDDLNLRNSVYEEYNSLTLYKPLNKVVYSGNTYLVLKEGTGVTPVDDGISYKLIVQGTKSSNASSIITDSEHRFATDAEKVRWNDTYTQNEVENKISQAVTNLDWKEAVPTFNDLSIIYSMAEEGWTASVNDEDKVYRYDGTVWKLISGKEIPLATSVLDGKMRSTDKVKLDGVEENANKYIHPLSHSLDQITETAIRKIMTGTERGKLGGIETNANNYIHPSSHPATMTTQDETHRFVTDTEKVTWNGKSNIGHAHVENDITNLDKYTQAEVETKLSTKADTHSHPYLGINENAISASKLDTARIISLVGDVSGSVGFDGTGNVSITATIADDSHNHIISNVDGLQSALDAKANTHLHPYLLDTWKPSWGLITDKPTTFTPSAHNHNDIYYTESEMNIKLNAKSDIHSHPYLGLTAKAADSEKVDGINGASLLRSDANDSFSGKLASSTRQAGIYGQYDSHKTDHIWSMGTGYKIDANGANFGNLYGLAYKHTNNATGGTMGGGHQMVWCTNGNPKGAIGDSGIWSAGTITATGTLYANNGIVIDGKTVIDNGAGWHRAYGKTGLYNDTYGGGIYQTDSTYVKVYGTKHFWIDDTKRYYVGSTKQPKITVSATAPSSPQTNDIWIDIKA